MSGSSVFDALTDPGVSALFGAAQGFANAALPQRMPTPFGAVLGLGAGGALQGVKTSQALQLANQQTQAAKMANLVTASSLPLMLSKNQVLSDLWQHPEKMQQMMNGGPMPTPSSVPADTSGLTPVSTFVQKVNGSENATGNPGALNASGPGGTPSSSAVGNGQFIKGTWLPLFKQTFPDLAAGKSDDDILALRADPNMSTAMTAAYAQQNAQTLQAKGVPPTAANLAMAHRYGPDGAIAVVQADPSAPLSSLLGSDAMRANPTWSGLTAGQVRGNATMRYGSAPVAFGAGTPSDGTSPALSPTGPVTPGNALSIANQYEQQANLLDRQLATAKFLQAQGMPAFAPPGDPAALRTAAQQYRALALAGPTSGAQAAAKAENEITTDRFGNRYRGPVYLGRGPEVKPVWNGATGQMEWGDVGGIGVGAQLPGAHGAAGSVPGGQHVVMGGGGQAEAPPPTQAAFMHERGKDLAEQFQKIDADANSAKEGNYLFDNLRNDSQSWQMGKFANWEGDARAWLSAAGHAFGIPAENDIMKSIDKPLADYQAFLKSSGLLLRTAVHDVSSRAAVQEYNLIGQTLPQPTTSAQGFNQVADQWQGANDFRLAKQRFAQQYQSHPQDFNVDFNTQVSPISFMLNRMAMTPQGQSDMKDMLGRLQATPGGKLAARHMLQQYNFAKQHNLFDGLPPAPGSEPTPQSAPAGGGG